MKFGNFPDILPLTKRDINGAASLLTSAFAEDSKMSFLFPGDNPDHSSALFKFELSYGLRYGWVFSVGSPPTGIAIWLPSEKSEITTFRGLLSGGISLQRVIGKEAMKRLLNFSEYIDRKHMSEMPSPHLYLFVLGVHPDCQGKGFGGKLLHPVLEYLNSKGLDCYLTTQNEKNISFYEHFGFEVISKEFSDSFHIPMVTMKKKSGREIR